MSEKIPSEEVSHVDRAIWVGVRAAKPWGGSCHVSLPRKFLGREVVVVVLAPKDV